MSSQSAGAPTYLQYFSNTNDFIQSAYTQFLHRSPDSDGLSYWTAQINSGVTYAAVIDAMLNSSEYMKNINTNTEFVTSLYQNLLHRTPETGAVDFWVKQAGLQSKDFVVNSFLESREFQKDASSQNNTVASGPLLFASEGGGIRAMTTDAGLIAGLIKSYENSRGTKIDISNFFSHVDAVSSNSGSSWFVSALAYSAPFKMSLQNYSQMFDPLFGYMGLMGKSYIHYLDPLMKASATAPLEGDWSNISDLLSHLPNLNWANFLNETIYAPYNTADQLKSTNLYSSLGQRTDALSKQALIFEAALSVDKAAISPYTPIGEMVATVTNAGVDGSGKDYQFIPSALTSMSSYSTQIAPVIPTIQGDGLNLTFTGLLNISQETKVSIKTTAPNLSFNGLSVFTASAASSAALAVENSMGASGNSPLILQATQELATPVLITQLGSASLGSDFPNAAGKNYPDVGNLTLDNVQNAPVLRLGDGHYADGTSVTAGMSYFTPDQLKNGFNVTLFGNMAYKDYALNLKPDVSFLSILGIGQDPSSTTDADSRASVLGGTTNLNHPSNKIFDLVNVPDPTKWNPKPVWSYSALQNDFAINYYEVSVKTSDSNPYAQPGILGTIKLWEVASDSGMITAPTEKGWSTYSQLYNDIITGLQSDYNGNIGATLLSASLGLS